MNARRKQNIIIHLAVVFLASACTPAVAVEVFLNAENKTVSVDDSGPGLDTTFDIFFNTDTEEAVNVAVFGAWMTLTPQPGAVGSVVFNPPEVNQNADNNIEPATTNPINFDLLFGFLVDENTFHLKLGGGTELDEVSVPHGAGIAALPIHVAPGTRGDFLVTFAPDSEFAGFLDASGFQYPGGTHVSGTLTVVPEPTTLTLATLGLIGVAMRRQRRRK